MSNYPGFLLVNGRYIPSSAWEARWWHAKYGAALMHWKWEYYIVGESSVSDDVFDDIEAHIRAIEAEYPGLDTALSPTHLVGFNPLQPEPRPWQEVCRSIDRECTLRRRKRLGRGRRPR